MQSTHSIEEEAAMNYFGYVIIFNKKWNLLKVSRRAYFFPFTTLTFADPHYIPFFFLSS